jgi:hypothetical protein
MKKTVSTTRALGILVLLVAAITGSREEDVSHWVQYGEHRLQKALTREVRTEHKI